MSGARSKLRPSFLAVAVLVVAACSSGGAAEQAEPPVEDESTPDAIVAEALARHVPDTGDRFVATALVVRASDGSEVAWGSSSPVDRALGDVQRPSGSTLKLPLLVAAARAGVLAGDGLITGRGCDFPDGVSTPIDDVMSIMSVRQAAAVSSNCAFGKLARVIGAERLGATVRDLGIDRQMDFGTGFGLGANTVSMSELATIGVSLMQQLSDDSTSAEAAERVIDMTADVLVSGTARGNEIPGRWAVAKTGTAARSTDAWIVGATPQFVTVVWMGNPGDPEDGMVGGTVPGYDVVHGGDVPATVWNEIMTRLHGGSPPVERVEPPAERDVVVVVDPTVDCLANPDLVRDHTPALEVTHIATGGPIQC